MKVLVTGGAGYIGSHTLRKLLKAGHVPVVFDNLSTGFREAIPAGVDFVLGDVRNKELVLQTLREKKIEAVIHFAAKLVVPESVRQPLEYYENNVMGTLLLLQACVAAHVKYFIFSSTAAVYGNPARVPVTEETQPSPLNPYGTSKWMSEQILADTAYVHPLKYVVLRYFNVAGASIEGDNGQRTANATHLVKVASQAATGKRSQVEIFGTDYKTEDGTGVRDYIHVDDLAQAHTQALDYLEHGGPSEIMNVGYGRGFSVREVLREMKQASGRDFQIKESARREGDASTIVADSRKIQSKLAWKPHHDDLSLICKTAYEWEKKNS